MPLAVDRGLIAAESLRQAWQLWPFILIGAGLGLVLERTKAAVVGTLVVAVTVGLMGGAVLAGGITFGSGFSGAAGCGVGGGAGGGAAQAFAGASGSLAEDAIVRLEMTCGEMAVTAAPGMGWTLAGRSGDGRTPDVRASDARLEVRAPERSGITIGAMATAWQVTLPQASALDVTVVVNAGSAKVDLAGARVGVVSATVNAGDARLALLETTGLGRLAASVNAGSLAVTLPPSGLEGHISVNAGSAKVCTPDGVGLRFRTADNALGTTNFAQRGLVQVGSTWTTPGYDAAPIHIDLDISANLGSISLNPEGGCE